MVSTLETSPIRLVLSVGYNRSTRDHLKSTLETSPRKVNLPVWDSVSTLDQVRSTHSGNLEQCLSKLLDCVLHVTELSMLRCHC
ncbi:hypothetical protein Taro_053120 [Colocasia esculenta]|uniref:Uncharacterized protein n=1 Tax=Colocasia esculenta TaxID=4460 RepID=A0A843XKC0_COLES|nr:hypothetical protein [Colocasia esculenta]